MRNAMCTFCTKRFIYLKFKNKNYGFFKACNGIAPLNDAGDYIQRCNDNSQCPIGSWCNQKGYCCPHGKKIFNKNIINEKYWDWIDVWEENKYSKLVFLQNNFATKWIRRFFLLGETACASQKSIGHTCLSQKPGTFWFIIFFFNKEKNKISFLFKGIMIVIQILVFHLNILVVVEHQIVLQNVNFVNKCVHVNQI